jgi:WD40 repeat protein
VYSRNGDWVAAGGEDGTIRFYDPRSFQKVRSLRLSGGVIALALAPSGRALAAGSMDGAVSIWDLATGRVTRRFRAGLALSIAYTPDGRRLVTGTLGGRVTLWDAEAGRELFTLADKFDYVASVAVTPDGRRIVGLGMSEGLKVWESPSTGPAPVHTQSSSPRAASGAGVARQDRRAGTGK